MASLPAQQGHVIFTGREDGQYTSLGDRTQSPEGIPSSMRRRVLGERGQDELEDLLFHSRWSCDEIVGRERAKVSE